MGEIIIFMSKEIKTPINIPHKYSDEGRRVGEIIIFMSTMVLGKSGGSITKINYDTNKFFRREIKMLINLVIKID